LTSLAPEECARCIIKKAKLTGNEDGEVAKTCRLNAAADSADDRYCPGDSSLRGKCQQVSQPIDKPINEVPANVQHPARDNGQQINEALQGMHLFEVVATGAER
jgi:hypothetical protein